MSPRRKRLPEKPREETFPLRRKKVLHGSRRLAREKILQVFTAATTAQVPWESVFEHIFYRDFTAEVPATDRLLLTPEEILELEADTPICWEESDEAFARQVLQAAEHHRETALELLRRILQHWDVERLVPVDRLILLLSMAEMIALPQTPVPIIIDEAVELAKKYSTEHSGPFVNGVLEAAYYHMVRVGLRPASPDMRPLSDEEVERLSGMPEEYRAALCQSREAAENSSSSLPQT